MTSRSKFMEREEYLSKISEILSGVTDLWVLNLIYRCIVNVTKESEE